MKWTKLMCRRLNSPARIDKSTFTQIFLFFSTFKSVCMKVRIGKHSFSLRNTTKDRMIYLKGKRFTTFALVWRHSTRREALNVHTLRQICRVSSICALSSFKCIMSTLTRNQKSINRQFAIRTMYGHLCTRWWSDIWPRKKSRAELNWNWKRIWN